MKAEQQEAAKVAHVLLLPLPLQGPINCFLKLAHLLSAPSDTSNLCTTFINASFVRTRLPDLPSLLPNVRFCTFSDGILGDQPRPSQQFATMVGNFEAEVVSHLPEFLKEPAPVTCMIVDGVFTLAGRKAMELGIPVVYFSTLSPSCVWASCALIPRLLDHAHVPFKTGDNLDEPVTTIPGSESSLRRRDLPSVCRAQDTSSPYVQLVLRECRELPVTQGLIINSFDQLEGTALLAELRSIFPNLYNIGPIHFHFKTRLMQQDTEQQVVACGSLWQEDKSCIDWLDAQPAKSVLFVSFGSIVRLTDEQLMEFWYGLVNSGVRFLWVQRLNSVVDDEECRVEVPEDIVKGTKDRGCLVKWAPQEEVLAHRAIGGFLTHSGWNSTLESIVEGVPMICWPVGIDQMVVSRFVEEVWKIGIDMKDICDRVVIADMVTDLMQTRRDEFSENANALSEFAIEAAQKGGSSWCDLDRLIEDIKFMRLEVPT